MNRTQQIRCAAGAEKAPLVLKNAQVLNVFTEQLQRADVALCGDTIVGVGNYAGEREVDYTGKIICPGFIDAHIHIESSLTAPLTLCKMMAPHGTTTLIADPHEIVNVAGEKGLSYFLAATQCVPMDVYFMLPSSVPSTPFETNGADFTAQDMRPFMSDNRVLGLGEVMCYPSVIGAEPTVMEKLELCQNKAIDGHAPGLSGRELQAYVCAGVQTEHECTTFAEAREKLAAGLSILIREGSAAQNLEAIVTGLVKSNLPTERFLFCTDDKHIDDIEREGHIDYALRRATALGLSPIKAVKMASYYAAQTYRLKDVGAVAAGYRANLVVLEDLSSFTVNAVYHAGELVTEEYLNNFSPVAPPPEMSHSVHIGTFTAEDIALPRREKNHVIEIVPGQILTRHLQERVGGGEQFVPDAVYNKLCVAERHRGTGNIAAAPLKGFGMTGAIASSVGHDSHNIIAAGDNDADILCAMQRIAHNQGGYCIIKDGKVLAELPLPIGGLMSSENPDWVVEKNRDMVKTAHELGVPEAVDPLFTLSFLSLAVIPQLRLTDEGLFDVDTFSMVEE